MKPDLTRKATTTPMEPQPTEGDIKRARWPVAIGIVLFLIVLTWVIWGILR